MKRLAFLVALVAAALSITSLATAAGGKLRCFADGSATCTLNSDGSATITGADMGAGVYLTNGKSTGGFALASVDYSFTYSCAGPSDTTSCVGGGAPRWSIPISTDGNSKAEGYAFLDANGCGDSGLVSTTEANCAVTFQGVTYANWDAFAAANPTYTIASALPFVVADVPTGGPITVSDVNSTKS